MFQLCVCIVLASDIIKLFIFNVWQIKNVQNEGEKSWQSARNDLDEM